MCGYLRVCIKPSDLRHVRLWPSPEGPLIMLLFECQCYLQIPMLSIKTCCYQLMKRGKKG